MNSSAATTAEHNNGLGRHVSGIVCDSVRLVQLQARLFSSDLQSATERIRWLLVLLSIATGLLFGALLLVLLALAYALNAYATLSLPAALLCSSGIALLLAVTSMSIGMQVWRGATREFDRSRDEWARNFDWFQHRMRTDSVK